MILGWKLLKIRTIRRNRLISTDTNNHIYYHNNNSFYSPQVYRNSGLVVFKNTVFTKTVQTGTHGTTTGQSVDHRGKATAIITSKYHSRSAQGNLVVVPYGSVTRAPSPVGVADEVSVDLSIALLCSPSQTVAVVQHGDG